VTPLRSAVSLWWAPEAFYGNQNRSPLSNRTAIFPNSKPISIWRLKYDTQNEVWQALFTGQEARINVRVPSPSAWDGMPAACDNIRIRRCRLYQEEAFRGYSANKQRYYYGLEVHLVVRWVGQKPVGFCSRAGLGGDMTAFKSASTCPYPKGGLLLPTEPPTEFCGRDPDAKGVVR